MLLLRAVFLELLMGFHVVGAAMLFRRLFPRESPWFAFFVPILGLLLALNFFEHFVALTNLGWLLPFSLAGLGWVMIKSRAAWNGMEFPTILFLALFTYVLALKCLLPDISNYSEAAYNLGCVMNYCFGGTLPPVDSWLPPYDYGGYYTFQHYGAAVLKRFFFLDLGTAYNLAFVFLMTWLCFMPAAAGYSISGKKWIALATMLVIMAGSAGSVPFFMYASSQGPDYGQTIDLNSVWNDPTRNPFAWLCAHEKDHPSLNLLPPAYAFFWSEFHATVGGSFLTITTMFVANEVLKKERSDWPWICLPILPMVAIMTSALFMPIIAAFAGTSLLLALGAGRRPRDWKFVALATTLGLVFTWPSVNGLMSNDLPQAIFWTDPADRTPFWMILIQWWPLYLPCLFLIFAWFRLSLMARLCLVLVPSIFIGMEFVTLDGRDVMTEKMWGALYGAGLVTLLPFVFMQKEAPFRALSAGMIVIFAACFLYWMKAYYWRPIDPHNFCRLQGDAIVQSDAQTRRLVQVLKNLHGATVLPGKSYWNFNYAPEIVEYSENLCFIGYTTHEYNAGHDGEEQYRDALNNAFYAGKLPHPLPFLRANRIAAVLIWPEDQIPDDLLRKFRAELAPDFFYIDCKLNEPNNAGVFLRASALSARALSALESAALPAAPAHT
jgi:hypothetical protein